MIHTHLIIIAAKELKVLKVFKTRISYSIWAAFVLKMEYCAHSVNCFYSLAKYRFTIKNKTKNQKLHVLDNVQESVENGKIKCWRQSRMIDNQKDFHQLMSDILIALEDKTKKTI